MTNQSTIDKLLAMRLTAMSDAFLTQQNDQKMKEIPFEDRFGMLVDIEYSSRKNNRRKRLIKVLDLISQMPALWISTINLAAN